MVRKVLLLILFSNFLMLGCNINTNPNYKKGVEENKRKLMKLERDLDDVKVKIQELSENLKNISSQVKVLNLKALKGIYKIESIDDYLFVIGEKLDYYDKFIRKMNKEIEENVLNIKYLQDEVASCRNQIDNVFINFRHIYAKLSNLENNISLIENNLHKINVSINKIKVNLENQIENNTSQIGSIRLKLLKVGSVLNKTNKEIGKVKENLKILQTKIENVTSTFSSKLSTLERDIGKIKSTIKKIPIIRIEEIKPESTK